MDAAEEIAQSRAREASAKFQTNLPRKRMEYGLQILSMDSSSALQLTDPLLFSWVTTTPASILALLEQQA
jgi:hypothetical protein